MRGNKVENVTCPRKKRLPSHVSRDNNLYVVGDISREVERLETPETNNYQM